MDNRIIELESKLQILEAENEVLSSKSEENLLLSRAFSEINSVDNLDNIFANSLESISILLNIPFSGVFENSNNAIECIQNYSLICTEEKADVQFLFRKKESIDLIFSEKQLLKHGEIELEFKNLSCSNFNPKVYLLIPLKTTFSNDRLFVFADDDVENINENKKELLEKIVKILSSRIERIFYHDELERMNNELKNTLKTLKAAQSQLVQNEKMTSLGVLTAGVAHEINNPLNYILGAYTGLKRIHSKKSYFAESQKITVLLESLKTGVDRASNIVSGLNQFSRNSTSNNENCNIHEIIDSCLSMFNNQLKHRISIEKYYAPVDIIIKGNVGNLHQVFINLLSNAEQAISENGTISIKTLVNTNQVNISITDTGDGISKENLQKVTDPFFTTKDPGKGTGLGLSIVYNIIQDFSGSLEFESGIGKGTTVIITLPNNT